MASFFDEAGGADFFHDLVAAFYRHVAVDPVLEPMYPAHDMDGAERRLTLFLQQYWGGPDTYSQERGHPRLRMRHMAFHIDRTAHDHWLACMEAALNEVDPPEEIRAPLWDYVRRAAFAMMNAH